MTTEMRGQGRVAAYHEQAQREGPSRAWLERIARGFRLNPRLEALLALPHDTRAALLAGNPSLRISLGGYEQTKAAHEQLQEMTR